MDWASKEVADTAHVASELADRNEGTQCEVRENVGSACCNGKIGGIKLGYMAGVNDADIETSDGNAAGGPLDVDKRGIDGEEMAAAASVGDAGGDSGSRGGTWAFSRAIC